MTDRFPSASSSSARAGGGGEGGSLRQSLLKERIAKLPHLPAVAPGSLSSARNTLHGNDSNASIEEEEQEEENDGLGSLPSSNQPSSSAKPRSHTGKAQDDYSPLSASDCFQEALEVAVDDAKDGNSKQLVFRVYYTPAKASTSKGSKSVADASVSIAPGSGPPTLPSSSTNESGDGEDQEEITSPTIFLLHHGAGYSALSYALVAKSITEQTRGKAGVLAYDCRGHGRTAREGVTEDLSLDRLTADGLAILEKLFASTGRQQPTLVLVGHSMGGAVVVSMAHALTSSTSSTNSNRPRVAGVAVLDVVEGTAMAALPSMKTIVTQMPTGFNSVADAIRWHMESGTIVNLQSARRSVPSLLRDNPEAKPGQQVPIEEPEEPVEEMMDGSAADAPAIKPAKPSTPWPFIWRHDLLATEPFWQGWFQGLSASFLAVRCARLLLLAGTDRLDKDLMIGQMQGKYQLVVFADVGHSLQEDAPQRTAQTLVDFWRRNEMVDQNTIKSLRKVGQN